MTKEQYDDFVEKFGKEAAIEMKKLAAEVEKNLNTKYEEVIKGHFKTEDFEQFKKEEIAKVNTKLQELEDANKKLEDVAKEQGIIINIMKESGGRTKVKTLQEFIQEQVPTLKELYKSGKMVEFTSAQLKAAGVTSIAGSIEATVSAPGSPYLPGLTGGPLEIFDVVRNPNFILNHVDVGRTDSFRLAWINETAYEGVPSTDIAEGGPKPLLQHKFIVEFSEAKKAAGYVELTEEFEQDVPQLATKVRRMIQDDVVRSLDDAIQLAVIAAARPYEITGLNGDIEDSTMWDALRAMIAQVEFYNFIVNSVAVNPLTMVKVETGKGHDGHYLNPPFAQRIYRLLVQANKLAVDNALVGDLTQYKVDIYKDFVLKMGWINDQFIHNKFSILGEIRYHRYISDNRKKALVHTNVKNLEVLIDGGSPS